MDGNDVVEAVRRSKGAELDELDSERALVAATGGQVERGLVLRSAAAESVRATETFETWADDADEQVARECFAQAAQVESGHYQQLMEHLQEGPEPVEADDVHTYLRSLDDAPGRGGGLVGRNLAAERSLSQFVAFFEERGDETADVFHTLQNDAGEWVEEGASFLDDVCASAAEYESAQSAAETTVDSAHREFRRTLAGLGID